ncbi:MAG: hypothetical protein KF688_08620 [Pirellulales bacterium]|nr:hypothetical protein [Pirellulales bacterium]MBX3431718.1 hypothetical protein [Pirellulales bacterium]
MNTLRVALIALAVGALGVAADEAAAEMPYLRPLRRAQSYNWHGNYAYTQYGRPTALVVPPTAQLQTNWSWGAPSSRVSRIDHQFTRNDGGPGSVAARPTPLWPMDTTMFGVYYVRGPWYPTQP